MLNEKERHARNMRRLDIFAAFICFLEWSASSLMGFYKQDDVLALLSL